MKLTLPRRLVRNSIALATILAFMVAAALLVWAARPWLVTSPAAPSVLPGLMPRGAMLYIEAKNFSALLSDWNSSTEKQQWLHSANFEVFSRSRLFLRLADAQREFTAAVSIPPDMNLLSQAAGHESALALYDIGKLEFLYVSRAPSAGAMQSALWQARTKFEPRSSAGLPFFVHTDAESGRVLAFAFTGDYLLLATREDLLAASLELLAARTSTPTSAQAAAAAASAPNSSRGSAPPASVPAAKVPSLVDENWYKEAVSAAGAPGALRMVLNMTTISAAPHFRSYWIQSNVKEMQQYSAAVSDLYRSRDAYREERVLIYKPIEPTVTSASNVAALAASAAAAKSAPSGTPTPPITLQVAPGRPAPVTFATATSPASSNVASSKSAAVPSAPSPEDEQAVAALLRLVPSEAVVYRAFAAPGTDAALALLETKTLSPRLSQARPSKLAPTVYLSGGTVGSSADLETRIDQPPIVRAVSADGLDALRASLDAAKIRAALSFESTSDDPSASFVEIHSAVVLAAASDWDAGSLRASLARAVGESTTLRQLGAAWRSAGKSPNDYLELDGLVPLRAAVRGNLLLLSTDAPSIVSVLSRLNNPVSAAPAVYAAGFRHAAARPGFLRVTSALDLAGDFSSAPDAASATNESDENGGNDENQDPADADAAEASPAFAGLQTSASSAQFSLSPVSYPAYAPNDSADPNREPAFFSSNLASLSRVLSRLDSESIVIRRSGDKTFETIIYHWK
jgi:hypothetical protein